MAASACIAIFVLAALCVISSTIPYNKKHDISVTNSRNCVKLSGGEYMTDWSAAEAVAKVTGANTGKSHGRWVVDNDPSPRFPLYTRANIGEVFPEVVQPFSWTLWGIPHADFGWRLAFEKLGAFDLSEFTPDTMEMLGVFGGYGYLNASASRIFGERTPGLSAEAVDASFFGEQPDVPPYVPRPGDVSKRHADRLGAMLAWLFTATTLPDIDAMRAEMLAVRAARPDFGGMDNAALLAHVICLNEAHFRRLWVRHIEATYHSTVPAGVIGGIAAAMGRGNLVADLLTSAEIVDSAMPAHALWALSRLVASNTAATRLFDAGREGLAARLNEAPDFKSGFASFIHDYGFRGPMEWEMRSRTWEIDPATPLAAIDQMRRTPEQNSPAARADVRAAARNAAIATLRDLLADTPDMLAQFDAATGVAGRFFAARERTKTNCAMLLHEMRMAMWELGSRFVGKGLVCADQFGLFTVAEWQAALADDSIDACLLETRARQEAERAALMPPFIIDGSVPPLDAWQRRDSVAAAPAGNRLQGQPGCAGVARGIARIVTNPGDPGDFAPGDILVAAHTDPSWTPLMAAAGGVIVNVGAAVSHAVIVARELGVPCAVSVTGATAIIPHGSQVEVDGGTGTVTLL
jgi:pyruvate,water dikinase